VLYLPFRPKRAAAGSASPANVSSLSSSQGKASCADMQVKSSSSTTMHDRSSTLTDAPEGVPKNSDDVTEDSLSRGGTDASLLFVGVLSLFCSLEDLAGASLPSGSISPVLRFLRSPERGACVRLTYM
jgi:hypothetical protein